jgi:hypothetical protein
MLISRHDGCLWHLKTDMTQCELAASVVFTVLSHSLGISECAHCLLQLILKSRHAYLCRRRGARAGHHHRLRYRCCAVATPRQSYVGLVSFGVVNVRSSLNKDDDVLELLRERATDPSSLFNRDVARRQLRRCPSCSFFWPLTCRLSAPSLSTHGRLLDRQPRRGHRRRCSRSAKVCCCRRRPSDDIRVHQHSDPHQHTLPQAATCNGIHKSQTVQRNVSRDCWQRTACNSDCRFNEHNSWHV